MALHPPVTCQSHSPSIFDSNDALKIYLQDVRQRREQRQFTRQERERLQEAIALVRKELDAAEQDSDTEIILELEAVLEQFTQRLSLLSELPYAHAIVRSPSADVITFRQMGANENEVPGATVLPPMLPLQTAPSASVEFRATPCRLRGNYRNPMKSLRKRSAPLSLCNPLIRQLRHSPTNHKQKS